MCHQDVLPGITEITTATVICKDSCCHQVRTANSPTKENQQLPNQECKIFSLSTCQIGQVG